LYKANPSFVCKCPIASILAITGERIRVRFLALMLTARHSGTLLLSLRFPGDTFYPSDKILPTNYVPMILGRISNILTTGTKVIQRN